MQIDKSLAELKRLGLCSRAQYIRVDVVLRHIDQNELVNLIAVEILNYCDNPKWVELGKNFFAKTLPSPKPVEKSAGEKSDRGSEWLPKKNVQKILLATLEKFCKGNAYKIGEQAGYNVLIAKKYLEYFVQHDIASGDRSDPNNPIFSFTTAAGDNLEKETNLC